MPLAWQAAHPEAVALWIEITLVPPVWQLAPVVQPGTVALWPDTYVGCSEVELTVVPWQAAHVLSWVEIAVAMSAWSIFVVVGAWHVAQAAWRADAVPLECVIAVRLVPVWQPVPPQESSVRVTS